VREALDKVPFIVSFGNFLDETSTLADLILPDHSYLESWMDDAPESGTVDAVLSLAPPAMLPLHETRALPDVLLDVARRLGGEATKALPWKSYEEMLQATFTPLRHTVGSVAADADDDFWDKLKEQGGWWSGNRTAPARSSPPAGSVAPVKSEDPTWDGAAAEYPFQFLPYVSQQFLDGTHANLSWLQELPEVLSTAIWSSWVEINPQTASRLGIQQSDLIEVSSQHGAVRAPAVLSPGVAPDVIAMPAGQGHEAYGRYATGRGANPARILAPQMATATGSLAWASTRVKVARVGSGNLILFSGGPTEFRADKLSR
jgi:anaerobic selenocysteine-containing dehydrogenase